MHRLPVSSALWCDTESHNWLIGKAPRCLDQSQRSPAGTIEGMLAARCAFGMKPFRQCTESHESERGLNREVETFLEASSG
jgi:hypothetical protein